jgi:hypothetical protein
MKKRLSTVAALVCAVLLALAWHYYHGASVPAGQPPLVALTSANLEQLSGAFNAATGEVRVVLLLSPT